MSKQIKTKNKAHLFDQAGPVATTTNSPNIGGVTAIATGGLTLADSIYTPFRDVDNTDVQLIKPTNVGQIRDYNTLQDFQQQLDPQQISYEEAGGHTRGQTWANFGKGAGAGASIGAGIGSFIGPIGTVVGGAIGGIVGGAGTLIAESFGGKKAKRRQLAEQAKADENYNTQLAMLNNQAYNIGADQLAAQRRGYINALGGNLHTNSTTWSNGLNYIGNGGSHESNPNDGVAISTAPDGLQNKVEEGEVVWNDDYVFSKRLKVPKKDLEKNKWKGETYADIAKKLMDESAERPNDPITLRGLDDSLSRLRDSQEELKAKQEGNRIKKEIASMPPELLAQMQQVQQQPTEEEMMQQQAMEQPVDQTAMVDPGMQQPMIEQPPLYSMGGPLKGGPGKWVHLSDNSKYDYALNKRPIAAIFDDIFEKNKSRRQPLVYKREQPVSKKQNVVNDEIDYTFDDINDMYNQSNYISFDKQDEDMNENKFSKGGHLYSGDDEYNQWLKYVNIANDYNHAKDIGFTGSLDDYTKYRLNQNPVNYPEPEVDLSWIWKNDKKNKGSVDYSDVIRALGREPVFKNDRQRQRYAKKNLQKNIDNITAKAREEEQIKNRNLDATYLRFVPAFGASVGVLNSLINRPDYSNPKAIENAAAKINTPVSAREIDEYVPYKPLDDSYYMNQLNAQQNAANNAITSLSNGNRSMALASMMANDYAYNNQRGAANRQGAEYNDTNRLRYAEFNRGTKQFNAQQYMQAAMHNAQQRAQSAGLISEAAKMREAIDNAYGASQSANWTNLFDNLGGIGKDIMNNKMTKGLYGYDIDLTGAKTFNGQTYVPLAKKSKDGFKRGGYLTIKTNNRRKE